ncbi:Sjoegren syndrome nuclear autoantigen 1 isoform B [Patagioenas fasciata monilis]|uniref:Sjoegren syndrome nuclear autoantigen 1 isoform B n=1 Tax=Patagioenas fasciata monilis TaxID=372326 RepID=A0A1V4KLU9_PATFA|nr:Sjoegren syndrome nuclear autoantigen 1 isoform B [Patagioenas fasciata monilis]
MTQQGAVLQGYNNELVKCIEDLCIQKEELNRQIQQAEEEKNKLQHEIQVLKDQLDCVCENLAQKQGSQQRDATLLIRMIWLIDERMAA